MAGLTNYQISAVKDLGSSDIHFKSIEQKQKKVAKDAGEV